MGSAAASQVLSDAESSRGSAESSQASSSSTEPRRVAEKQEPKISPEVARPMRRNCTRPLLKALVEDFAWALGVDSVDGLAVNVGQQVHTHHGTLVDRNSSNLRFSYKDVPKAFCVFRRGLPANPEVSVRIGPVIGKVTDSSAVILVETNMHCDVTLNLARATQVDAAKTSQGPWPLSVDGSDDGGGDDMTSWPTVAAGGHDVQSMTFFTSGSVSISHTVEPNRPYTFLFEGLLPKTTYFLFLSDVCQEDIDGRVGRFKTLPSVIDSLRIAVLAGHRPPARAVGVANTWERVRSFARSGSDVTIVLHVGTTVDLLPASDAALATLSDFNSFSQGAKRDLERKARQILCDAYRQAWGRHESLRKVLAEIGSHIPAFCPPLDARVLRPVDVSDPTFEERQTLLKIGLNVYREYQRSLWHASSSEGRPDVRIDARDDATRLKAGRTARDPLKMNTPQQEREFLILSGTRSTATVEEWHVHRYGQVCLIVCDTKGPALSRGSKNTTVSSILQQSIIGQVLHDPYLKVIVLASDMPFLLQARTESRTASNIASESWCDYPEEIAKLLSKLFQWKHDRYPSREVVLLSAGPGFGTTGDVCDHTLGLSIPVVLTGPALGRVCNAKAWMLSDRLPERRFSYAYREPADCWNFGTVTIDLTASQHKPHVEVQLVDCPLPNGISWPDGAAADCKAQEGMAADVTMGTLFSTTISN